MNTSPAIDIDRYRKRHARKAAKAVRRVRYPQCDVWMFGKNGPGPHRCTNRGNHKTQTPDGTKRVCHNHYEQPHTWCWTTEEAVSRHKRLYRRRLEIERETEKEEDVPAESVRWT